MNLTRSWFKQLKQEWVAPEIIPERCVHTQCEVSTCTNCVESCPAQAWILDDSGLYIDTSLCDGCSLCVAACPESALGQTLLPAHRMAAEGKVLLLTCERVGEGRTTDEGVVPCLHAIGSSFLLDYYQAGYQQVLSLRGACETCSRYRGQDLFDQRLADLNELLNDREAPLIQHQILSIAAWDAHYQQLSNAVLPPPEQNQITNRRQFLRQAITFAVEKTLESTQATDMETPTVPLPWASRLPTAKKENNKLRYPFAIQLDKAICNGCDACVQLCPHQAITLETDIKGRALAYNLQPAHCTGCRICEDGCDQMAIHIENMQIQSVSVVPLIQTSCKACGNSFHYPSNETAHRRTYCRICAQHNHHRQLFQVL